MHLPAVPFVLSISLFPCLFPSAAFPPRRTLAPASAILPRLYHPSSGASCCRHAYFARLDTRPPVLYPPQYHAFSGTAAPAPRHCWERSPQPVSPLPPPSLATPRLPAHAVARHRLPSLHPVISACFKTTTPSGTVHNHTNRLQQASQASRRLHKLQPGPVCASKGCRAYPARPAPPAAAPSPASPGCSPPPCAWPPPTQYPQHPSL